jgi:membrane protease YdiL (CAAX protease family)
MHDDSQGLVFLFLGLSLAFMPLIFYFQLLKLPEQLEKTKTKLPFFSPFLAFGGVLVITNFLLFWIQSQLPFDLLENYAIAQAITIGATFVFLLIFVYVHARDVQQEIFGAKNSLKTALKGVLLCLLVYPIVMLLLQVTHSIVDIFYPDFSEEQLAIQLFRKLRATPWLFWSYAVLASTLIPAVEELLFRGFFQNWFVDRLGRTSGIVATAFLFAAAHFSVDQSVANIELMISLVVMGIILGVVFIKENSLLASMAMHGTFNACTFILFTIS